MRHVVVAAVLGFGLAACSDAPAPIAPHSMPAPDMATYARNTGGVPIPGQYIVRFRADELDVDGLARALASRHGGRIKFTYKSAIKGTTLQLPDALVAALRADPRVVAVEQDQTVSISAVQSPATWGLDRTDQRALPLDNSYTYNATGASVTAYIIDTGILFGHTEFGGRAVAGMDAVTTGGSAADCNGHGTHVAGTVGGSIYGVAKNVSLVAVRVLDCGGSGTISGVIAGVDWVTANRKLPAVANMSLGGGASTTLDNAVTNSIASGVTYAVAAGNGNALGIAENACNKSPARVATAVTVSATDRTDTKASWANFGSCVKIFAAGVSITSAWHTSPTATNTISGTSMAAPHVAGTAALYLQTNPTATPAAVEQALITNATSAVVKSGGTSSPDRLLYSGFIGAGAPAPTPTPTPAPVARFTSTCADLTCNFDASTSSAQATATYGWNFGDNTSGSGKTTSHAYAAAGTYSVILTVSDAGGTSTSTQSVTVTAPPPTAAPVARFTSSCDDEGSCSFDAGGSTGNGLTYSWSFGDRATGTGVTTSHSYNDDGTYSVTLTVKDSSGRTSLATQTVTVTGT